MNNNRANIAERRNRIYALILEGRQTVEISEFLAINRKTVSNDIKWLTKESRKYLNDMAKEILPFKYRQAIEGMEAILVECWKRYQLDGNLFALKLALDCRKEIISLCSNGISIMSVKQITDRANALGISLENDGR